MNDFELSYMHHARSSELLAEAERERRAKEAREGSRGEDREGRLAARLGKALSRRGASANGSAHRLQTAK